jgi:hypothetical protein
MKLFKKLKDGGSESTVVGYFLIEAKKLFSIVLLHFQDGSRDAYHSHAFNTISWVLRGQLTENRLVNPYRLDDKTNVTVYRPSLKPIFTSRDNYHKVVSAGDTWVISFRGPWADMWQEIYPGGGWVTLTHGREILEGGPGRP